MIKRYKIFIPEKGLTKEQLKVMANHRLSLSFFIKHEGEMLEKEAIPDWPDFLLQEVKEPVVLSADAYLGHMYNASLSSDERKRHVKTYKFADENGQLREYQRKGQVELRESIVDYIKFIGDDAESQEFFRMKNAIENLKPPTRNKNGYNAL